MVAATRALGFIICHFDTYYFSAIREGLYFVGNQKNKKKQNNNNNKKKTEIGGCGRCSKV